MKKPSQNHLMLFGVALLAGILLSLFLCQPVSYDEIDHRITMFRQLHTQNQFLASLIYFLIFFLLTAFSIPGLSLLMLAGGALIDFPVALVVVSFADTLGSAVAFLTSRYLFRNSLQTRHGNLLRVVNQGISQKGAFYLFSMRLSPLIPCVLINLVMGLTKLPLTTFCWVTQLGKLPHNMIYINAGAQVGQITSAREILSPGLFISFTMLGLFPLLCKKGVSWYKERRKGSSLRLTYPD